MVLLRTRASTLSDAAEGVGFMEVPVANSSFVPERVAMSGAAVSLSSLVACLSKCFDSIDMFSLHHHQINETATICYR